MSAQRSSAGPTLRDRLLSNTPDPVQSSILRDSAKGWGKSSSPSSSSGTTPLRIAKREGKPPFPLVSRRSSSSYKHVRSSNLVSKSPFKTQTSTPSRPSPSSDTSSAQQGTRRVSGEKRPRPDSMHEQAENERPLAFKRERRQSKAYQGLIEKEPVTKSPFKRVVSEEEQPPPVPPKAVLTPAPPPPAPPSSPPSAPPSRPITPSRSSLVSKRLHGPRGVDQPSLDGRRQRRKTVTFDERCDVLEFDRDEEEDEDPFLSSDEDDYGEPEQREQLDTHHSQSHDNAVDGGDPEHRSFEVVPPIDADQSITGIVDSMIQSASLPGLGLPSTPPRHPSLPADMETEDGVPYGRSHHAERARRRASVSSPAMSTPDFPFHDSEHAIQDSPSTPPRTAESSMDLSFGPDVPLGRSTHAERAHQDHQVDEVEEDINMIPPSPSPAKRPAQSEHSNRDALIPRFELQPPRDESSPKNSHRTLSTADPFSVSKLREDTTELSFSSFDDPVLDPTNLSIGRSEVSLSNLDLEAELQKVLNPPQSEKQDVPRLSDLIPCNTSFSTGTPPPPSPPLSFTMSGPSHVSGDQQVVQREPSPPPRVPSQLHVSPLPVPTDGVTSRPASPLMATLQYGSGSPTVLNMRRQSDSQLNISRFSGSPALRTGSPLREITSAQDLQSERPLKTRISREDVHMRLMRQRSMESPLGSPAPGPSASEKVDGKMISEQSSPPPQGDQSDKEDERHLDTTSCSMDVSAELATIQTAEKRAINSITVDANRQEDVEYNEEDIVHELPTSADDNSLSVLPSTAEPDQPQSTPPRLQSSFGMLETSFDLSGSLGMGLRDSMGSIQLGEMRSALDRLMDDVKGGSISSTRKLNGCSPVRIESVTEGTKVGQLNASTSSNIADDSMQTETDMDLSMDDFRGAPIVLPTATAPLPMQRAATDSVVYTAPSFRSPLDEEPAPFSPTKDAIKAREQLILEKRRQARRRDREVSIDYYTPPRPTSRPSSTGRPSRRRSRSTGDVSALTKSDLLLDIGISDTEEEHLADSISRELRRLDPELRQGNYRVREHEAIFASADAEQVSHTSFAGDVNSGKAWKAVRRPSDMNEYAKQIREYRSQEKPGKAHGKVFVRVLGVKGLSVPIPQQATALTCTLNNGIHFVTTPETRLSSDARIDQEFELIEHNKLEFTLTLKVRRDPHIVAQFKALVPPPPPAPAPQPIPPPPKPKGGMFGFLSSSPKKPVARVTPPPPPAPPHKLPDNLARYLKQDGTLARAFISFKDVAARCDVHLLEIKYPLIGQRSDISGGATTMELGEIVLQMFRLPSLSGILSNQLPLSLDECLRGLRHVAWHKVTYFEGTLTQNGGDCMSWRRRMFRVTGANLVAFNDVTKKATATINLKKAVAVEDTRDARSAALSPDGRHRDDYDSLIAVERSFRLVFPSDQEILFFADSDEEKAKWLEVLRALVGHIPPNPFWAELIWQRQEEMTAQPQSSGSAS